MPYVSLPDYPYRRGSNKPVTFTHHAAQLGDGYEDLSEHGFNPERWEFTAEFTGLTEAEWKTLTDFFRNVKSSTPFYFPVEAVGNKLVRLLSFNESTGDGDLWSVSATVKRTYRADE